MSWSFKRTGKSKHSLKLAVRQKLANSNQGGHFPKHGELATAIDNALDALPEQTGGLRYRVETAGHIGDTHGNLVIKVETASGDEIVD